MKGIKLSPMAEYWVSFLVILIGGMFLIEQKEWLLLLMISHIYNAGKHYHLEKKIQEMKKRKESGSS